MEGPDGTRTPPGYAPSAPAALQGDYVSFRVSTPVRPAVQTIVVRGTSEHVFPREASHHGRWCAGARQRFATGISCAPTPRLLATIARADLPRGALSPHPMSFTP